MEHTGLAKELAQITDESLELAGMAMNETIRAGPDWRERSAVLLEIASAVDPPSIRIAELFEQMLDEALDHFGRTGEGMRMAFQATGLRLFVLGIYHERVRREEKERSGQHMHALIDELTGTLNGRANANRSADTGGVIAIEFALHRAEQQWCRLRVAEQAAEVGAGVAARHGLTTEEARCLADAIREGLQAAGDDEEAGRQWLKAMRAYAIAAAKEAAA